MYVSLEFHSYTCLSFRPFGPRSTSAYESWSLCNQLYKGEKLQGSRGGGEKKINLACVHVANFELVLAVGRRVFCF